MELAQAEHRPHPAFLSSIALHGAIVLLIVLCGLAFSQSHPPAPQVFELVAGQGDNYMATQATALGSETGIKFDAPPIPAPPAPTPPAPQAQAEPPATLEPVPMEAAPAKPTPRTTAAPTAKSARDSSVPDFAREARMAQIRAESRIKMHELRLKREEEKKRRAAALAAARKAGVTYEQFLREQAARGRATGVIHGKSMEAGAGGKALTAEAQDAMAAWAEMLRERWRDNFVPPADFTESMVAHVKWYVGADGSVSHIRITHSNGNEAFGQAVVAALQQVTVPPPPSHRGDDYETDFSLKNED